MRPIISFEITPTNVNDGGKLARFFALLVQTEPSLRVSVSSGGRITVSGTGELQLEMIVDRIARELSVQVQATKPKVIYLEPIMLVQLTVAPDTRDALIADLKAREGRIETISPTIKALVPLASIVGYPEYVRAVTNGHGELSITFSSYEETTELVRRQPFC
jgi:translation elongation factor EF-G